VHLFPDHFASSLPLSQITALIEQREKEQTHHLEVLNRQRKSLETMTKEAAQERDGSLEKITHLESLLESQREELNEKMNLLATVESNLTEMTTARDVLIKERNELIEKLATYQELALEKESASTKRWNERIKSLELSLSEAEESLLVSQSTIKTYV
jgi:septal ring factor EnvC (AmiA/AmiB activator)